MPAQYEVTPISNATFATFSHSFADPKVCLVKNPTTRKYNIGIWSTSSDKLCMMNVPSTPITSPVNILVHKKIMFDTNQYFFAEGKLGGPGCKFILVKESAVVTDPAPLSPQVLEVLGFQLKNVESTSAPVPQEEEKKEETELKEEKQSEPAPEKKSDDLGHVVLGKVISSQLKNGRSPSGSTYIHEIQYKCPYKNDSDWIKAMCMFTRKLGEQFTTGSYISYRDMPKLQLFISDGGKKIELLTTEIDALCFTIHMSLIQPGQENSDDTIQSGIWFATDATINAQGEITMNMKHTETGDTKTMRGRRRVMHRGKDAAQRYAPIFLSLVLKTSFDFSKFVDGKLDISFTDNGSTGFDGRLYADEEAFNNDASFTRVV